MNRAQWNHSTIQLQKCGCIPNYSRNKSVGVPITPRIGWWHFPGSKMTAFHLIWVGLLSLFPGMETWYNTTWIRWGWKQSGLQTWNQNWTLSPVCYPLTNLFTHWMIGASPSLLSKVWGVTCVRCDWHHYACFSVDFHSFLIDTNSGGNNNLRAGDTSHLSCSEERIRSRTTRHVVSSVSSSNKKVPHPRDSGKYHNDSSHCGATSKTRLLPGSETILQKDA